MTEAKNGGAAAARRVLVSKFNMIGDVLISTALLENLKLAWPDCRITYATYDFSAPALAGCPHVSRVITCSKDRRQIIPYLARTVGFFLWFVFHRHDVYICLRDNNRGRFLGLLTGARVRVSIHPKRRWVNRWAYTHREPHEALHAVEKDLHALKALGLPAPVRRFRMHFTPRQLEEVRAWLPVRPFVQLHPCARWPYKEIPPAEAARLGELIHGWGYELVLTGPGHGREAQVIRDVAERLGCPATVLAGRLDLPRLAALSSLAALYVGCDTAAMHVAAGAGTPVVAWFGPSLPAEWGPWDADVPRCPYRNGAGLQRMGRHTIVQLQGDCIPCDRRGCGDLGLESRCLQEMAAERIFAEVRQRLPRLERALPAAAAGG